MGLGRVLEADPFAMEEQISPNSLFFIPKVPPHT
jgi:hypothetical protein